MKGPESSNILSLIINERPKENQKSLPDLATFSETIKYIFLVASHKSERKTGRKHEILEDDQQGLMYRKGLKIQQHCLLGNVRTANVSYSVWLLREKRIRVLV